MNAAHPISPTRSFRWPLIVLGLLLSHMSLMIWAVVIATHDKSNPVIPDYYQKAANWDRTHAVGSRP